MIDLARVRLSCEREDAGRPHPSVVESCREPRPMSAALAEIDGHLADLDSDLARMPGFKRNTLWHLDRVRAREGLVERRERLVALMGPVPMGATA
jgi:hypothetical protein